MGRLYVISGREDDDEDEATFGDVAAHLVENTTSHGIPSIAKARGGFKKTYWSILSLGFLAALTYNVYYISNYFFSYPISVHISLEHKEELVFPTVTLCNMSPVRQSLWENRDSSISSSRRKRSVSPATTIAPETVTTLQDTCPCCCGDTFYYSAPTNQTSQTSALQNQVTYVNESQYNRPALNEEFVAAEELIEDLNEISEEEKKSLGFTIESLILDCQFEGAQCYYSDFDTIFNPLHGNCYMFNTGWFNRSTKMSRQSGVRRGLQMIVNIEQSDYVSDIGDTAGIKLVVHPGDQMPFPEDEGLTVGPGKVTYVALTQVSMKRLGQPHGECTTMTDDHSDINLYEEHYPVNYSTVACQKTCLQQNIIRECGCADVYYPVKGKALDKEVSNCVTGNVAQDDCRYIVKKRFQEHNLTCDCADPCASRIYNNDISFGQWPSDVQRDTVLNKLGSSVEHLFNDASDPQKYTRNLLKVIVYYKEFNYEDIKEIPAYRGGNYASDLGGTVGLWFGLSLLTIFEFIEFLMDCFAVRCQKSKPAPDAKGRRHKNSESDVSIVSRASEKDGRSASASDIKLFSQTPRSASTRRSSRLSSRRISTSSTTSNSSNAGSSKRGRAFVPVFNVPQTGGAVRKQSDSPAPSYKSVEGSPPSYRSGPPTPPYTTNKEQW